MIRSATINPYNQINSISFTNTPLSSTVVFSELGLIIHDEILIAAIPINEADKIDYEIYIHGHLNPMTRKETTALRRQIASEAL